MWYAVGEGREYTVREFHIQLFLAFSMLRFRIFDELTLCWSILVCEERTRGQESHPR